MENTLTDKSYWDKRYGSQGEQTVHHSGLPTDVNEKTLNDRKNLIESNIDPDWRVLDFGCGVGNFTKIFSRKKGMYIGYDHIPMAISIAKRKNVGYRFVDDEDSIPGKHDALFTCCVFQHLKDREVKRIIDTFGSRISVFYEMTDTNINSPHVKGRPVEWFEEMLGDKADVVIDHVVAGEKHSLMIWK